MCACVCACDVGELQNAECARSQECMIVIYACVTESGKMHVDETDRPTKSRQQSETKEKKTNQSDKSTENPSKNRKTEVREKQTNPDEDTLDWYGAVPCCVTNH